ncbi:MAG: peptidoglycan-binding domain-containing protein, partial [Candidatus Nomurabacteria bacterium]|nr:peptidoglycan-binding domain-containing protein [Candidatus Nomurabacteria bacterium]
VNHFTTYKVDTVAPTVTKMGDNSADVILTAGTHNLVFSEKLSATAKTAVQNALTLGADTALSYGWTEGTLTITASSLTTFANDVLANISDIAGNATNNALLVDSVLSATQSTPDNNGNVTVSSTTPEVVITNGNATTTVTISSDNTNPTIDVSSFIGSNGTGTLPAINITSSNASNMTVAIPAGTEVVSASTTWNGVIAAPTVTTTSLPATEGQTKTLSTAIEIGFSGAKLTFSKAVKILLPGQAGKRAGYVRTGTAFTEITNVCASDSQVTGDALAADSECKIDVGSDLVIWTKHFTTFASYTQVLNPSGSWFVTSSGGSSGSTAPAAASPVVTANPTTSIAQIAPVGQVLGASVFNFLTDLRLGDKNNDVTELQKILIAGGLLKSEATGYFGALTKSALAKWQANNNLSATGLFNKASRDLVSGIVSAPTAKVAGVAAFSFLKDLRMGMKNDNVTELQKILIAEGLLNSEATGYFGSQTRAALAKWQAKNGLPSTGFFGSLSRAKLNK